MEIEDDPPLLVVNLLVRARGHTDAPLYRVVWTGLGSVNTFLVRVDGQGNWIEATPTRALQARLAPSYEEVDALEFLSRDEDPYASSERADPPDYALKRYALIKELVDGPNLLRILNGVRTTALYQMFAERGGTTRQTIAAWIKLYLTRGMCADALAGDLHKCGGAGKSRNTTTKIGRPRKYLEEHGGVGTQVNEVGRQILSAGHSVAKAQGYTSYAKMKEFIDLNYCHDWEPHARFTIAQIRHYVEKVEDPIQRQKRRHGLQHYRLQDRPYDGKCSAYGPGAEYQVDATVADVYLVSALNRNRVVGRPTIYIVSDTHSRLIVGVYVGFENPSILGAALVMESVVTPKVELCRRHALQIEEWQWPAHHLCVRLLHDRCKEFMSCVAWERLNARYGVDFDNTPPFRPDWKAIVESRFQLLNREWGEYVPGHVEQDYLERGGNDYRLDAVLTLPEFTRLFLVIVLLYNNRPQKRVAHDPGFVAEGLAPSPVERWLYGIKNYSGVLRAEPVNAVRACVYPRMKARVTKEGIALGNRYYETARTNAEQWFSRARFDGTWRVDVAFDPAAPESSVHVVHDDGTFEHATLRRTGAFYDSNPSLAEILLLNDSASRNYARGVSANANRELAWQQLVEDIIVTAARGSADTKKLSGVAVPCIKDMDAARAIELELERKRRAVSLATQETESPEELENEPSNRPTAAEWDDDGLLEEELAAIKRERECEIEEAWHEPATRNDEGTIDMDPGCDKRREG